MADLVFYASGGANLALCVVSLALNLSGMHDVTHVLVLLSIAMLLVMNAARSSMRKEGDRR